MITKCPYPNYDWINGFWNLSSQFYINIYIFLCIIIIDKEINDFWNLTSLPDFILIFIYSCIWWLPNVSTLAMIKLNES